MRANKVIHYEKIDRNTTLSLLNFDELILSAEKAYGAQSDGSASPPSYINMPVGKNFVHYKAGYITGSKYFAVKYSGGFWNNGPMGETIDYGFVMVHDATTGAPVVLFEDQGAITDYRTAAAGAVASKYLSRNDSRVVAVVGTGTQATLQVEALAHVRDITDVRVWGRSKAKADAYCTQMKEKLPSLSCTAFENLADAISGSDIVITATASKQPIVQSEWITPGMHISAIGACAPDMHELDSTLLTRARVFADSIEKCSVDGEIHHGIAERHISKSEVTGELGEVILGEKIGRSSDLDITVADLVGLGVQDLTAAETLMHKIENGI